jgi:hypothetical protein
MGWEELTVTGPRFRLLDHPKLDVIQIISVKNPLHLEKERAEPRKEKEKQSCVDKDEPFDESFHAMFHARITVYAVGHQQMQKKSCSWFA